MAARWQAPISTTFASHGIGERTPRSAKVALVINVPMNLPTQEMRPCVRYAPEEWYALLP